jgi:hypothetical protein
MRTIITLAAMAFLTGIAVLWSISTFERPKLVTEVVATEAAAPISPFEITVRHGRHLPVDQFTAEPF